MGGGGVRYTFLHHTFAFFCVWCSEQFSKKGTLFHTKLHFFTLIFSKSFFFYYFPISFHIVDFQRQNRGKKYPLLDKNVTELHFFRLFYTSLFYTTFLPFFMYGVKMCSEPPPPPPPPPHKLDYISLRSSFYNFLPRYYLLAPKTAIMCCKERLELIDTKMETNVASLHSSSANDEMIRKMVKEVSCVSTSVKMINDQCHDSWVSLIWDEAVNINLINYIK